MEIGTAEPIITKGRKRKRRASFSSGNGPSRGGNGGGGNDGGGDGFKRESFEQRDDTRPDKSRIVTWFLLLVVLMTFGGLIGAYVVVSTNGVAEWRPFDLPVQVWVSTALILVSSISYHIAKSSIDRGRQNNGRKWLLVTSGIGAAFISSQILVWLILVQQGVYMRGNPYAGFFYILTGIHAVHVLGGIIALGAIVVRSWHETEYGPELEYRRNLARSVGWYWHFMGVLWLALFVLLGFWK